MKVYVITTTGEPGRTRLRHFFAQPNAPRFDEVEVYASDVNENPHVGCWDAHRTIMLRNREPIVIFEDDAAFKDTFTLDVDYPRDWQLMYFGAQHMIRPLRHKAGIVKCQRVHATHAYAIRNPYVLGASIGPSTDARANHDVSHRLQRVVRHERMNVYAVSPLTVGQAALPSVIAPNFTRQSADYWEGQRAEPVMEWEMKGET